jgi:carbon-monoxide dehydrogenase large subunit
LTSEFLRHLEGAGRFTADLTFPGQAHGFVLRSPHAHAVIKRIDCSAAMARPGVLAIFTGPDLRDAGTGPLPCIWPVEQADGSPMAVPAPLALAVGRARYVGEPVAFVVAETRDTAADAAEEIEIDYAPLPAVVSARAGLGEAAPQLWPEVPGNTCFACEFGDRAATDAAFAAANHVVRRRLTFPRAVANPIEPRAAIAVPEDGICTLYTPSQGAQFLRGLLAGALGWDQGALHVVTPDVGGSFGIKSVPYPEQVLATHAARQLGRPVSWVAERSADGFLGDNHARDQAFDIELALDGTGRFLGVRLQTVANLGARLSAYSPINSTEVRTLPGPYHLPAGFARVTGVFTNTVPVDAYRGAGRAEMVYPLERAIDAAARELGIDRAEIRRRNFAKGEGPTRTNCFGMEIDNRDYSAPFEATLAAAGWTAQAQHRAEAGGRGRLYGLGLASYATTAFGGEERVRVEIDGEGTVTALCATQSSGQGHATAYAQAIAGELGVPPVRIRVVQGDTRRYAVESITAGSRSIATGVPACCDAARALIRRAGAVAAALMQCAEGQVSYAAGVFHGPDAGASVTFAELVRAAGRMEPADDCTAPVICAEGRADPGEETWPCGTHVCEVEIDPETGSVSVSSYRAVDDVGQVVAPDLARGQVYGGVAQGLGQALLEHCVYDAESGQVAAGSFMDYAMPRADNLPFIEAAFAAAEGRAGIHGLGEMGTIAAFPAVMNAVCDALGVEIDAPATAHRIWEALK